MDERIQVDNAVDVIRRLNVLLSISSGNLDSAWQIEKNLKFYRTHSKHRDAKSLSIPKVAKNLLKIHLDNEIGFAFFNFNEVSCCPLFMHSAILETVHKVKEHRDALFVFSGLRKSICPKGTYFTKKRYSYYRNFVDKIEQLVVTNMPASVHLRIFFI